MTSKTEPELLPCPFCGGEAVLAEDYDCGYSKYGRFWWTAMCPDGCVSIRDREEFYQTDDGRSLLKWPEKECVERWNTRSAPPKAGPDDGAPETIWLEYDNPKHNTGWSIVEWEIPTRKVEFGNTPYTPKVTSDARIAAIQTECDENANQLDSALHTVDVLRARIATARKYAFEEVMQAVEAIGDSDEMDALSPSYHSALNLVERAITALKSEGEG